MDKVIKAGKSGFPITKSQFLLKVGTVVNRFGLKTQFKNGVPGKDNWYGLKNRQPDIAIGVTQNCPRNRLMMMTRPVVNRYFDYLGKLMVDWACKISSINQSINQSWKAGDQAEAGGQARVHLELR